MAYTINGILGFDEKDMRLAIYLACDKLLNNDDGQFLGEDTIDEIIDAVCEVNGEQ